MKRSSPCRNRPMRCPECGYPAYGTRSWWDAKGFPTCPCGGEIRPTKPADLAWCGLISQDDCLGAMWTAICRENGWEDQIVRKGAAAKSWSERRKLIRVSPAGHCVYPGCGRWVADGADVCSAGHAQVESAQELQAIPF